LDIADVKEASMSAGGHQQDPSNNLSASNSQILKKQ